jgi:hypothetical protein
MFLRPTAHISEWRVWAHRVLWGFFLVNKLAVARSWSLTSASSNFETAWSSTSAPTSHADWMRVRGDVERSTFSGHPWTRINLLDAIRRGPQVSLKSPFVLHCCAACSSSCTNMWRVTARHGAFSASSSNSRTMALSCTARVGQWTAQVAVLSVTQSV